MGYLWQDLRYGVRVLWKSPGFTIVAVAALALGIGANSAIFSVVNSVLLRPLPYPEPERLVQVFDNFTNQGLPRIPVSVPEYLDYRDQNTVFETIAASTTFNANLGAAEGGEPERVSAAGTTHLYFETLGVKPLRGRTFLPADDQPGHDNVAIISESLWQRRYGGDPHLLGRVIHANNQPYTVIGIVPRLPGQDQVEFWAPIAFTPQQLAPTQRGSRFLTVIARLKPGVTHEQAAAEMRLIGARLAEQYPQNYAVKSGWDISVVPLMEVSVGPLRPALLILLGAVGFVLLIACANVANLLLARAAARQKEIALRTALGASRLRVVRQLLTESLVLSLVGGACGLVIAQWGLDLLLAFMPQNIPRLSEVSLDLRVLGFTGGVSLLTGLFFGLAPALEASRTDVNETLKEGGRGSVGSATRGRLRAALVISEVALSLVLLVGAGLLIKSFLRLRQVDPGFDATSVLTMRLALPQTKYREPPQRVAFFEGLMQRVETIPGVRAASAISGLPMEADGGNSGTTTGEGSVIGPGDLAVEADWRWITPRYFEAVGAELLRGRYLTPQDREGGQLVAIVDDTFAERYYPGQDPIGRRVKRGGNNSTNPWFTIVGVVRHLRQTGLDTQSRVQIYFPYYQDPRSFSMALAVRTENEPAALAAAVRAAVQDMDRDQPVYAVRPLREVMADSFARQRLSTVLLAVFAGLALLLASVGIYGVMAYAVSQQTRELGLRMALGAQPRDVLRIVLRKGMLLALAGIGMGLLGALALTRLMAGLLFGVSATDPATFAGLSALLGLVAFIATYIPARRATKVDPLIALRYE